MPHILVAGRLHAAGIALLERAPGVTFDYVQEVSEESYAPLIEGADGLIIRTQPLSAPTIARASRLRIVSRHGVGYDAVDLAALNARGITLCIVGDVNAVSVSEHTLMLMLACAKHLRTADRSVRSGAWGWRNQLQAEEISGKRLLLLGFGRTARHVARLAAAFGMHIRAYDPYLERQGEWPDGGVRPAGHLAEALGWADIISVHVPKGETPLLGAQEIAQIKRGAIIINTARGGIVDEAALLAALDDGQVRAAGIDVFDDEPPPDDHPLLTHERVILTPHIAGLTAEAAERMAVSAVQNVLDFFGDRLDPRLIVNRSVISA